VRFPVLNAGMITLAMMSCGGLPIIEPALAQWTDSSAKAGESLNHETGRAIFNKTWVSSPSSTQASDGLGPLYHARSCAACHPADGQRRAVLLRSTGQLSPALVVRLGGHDHHSPFGRQWQTRAIPGLAPEGSITVQLEQVSSGHLDGVELSRQRPIFQLHASNGVVVSEDMLPRSPRLAPALAGLGALAAIPASTILALADTSVTYEDDVRGRPHWVLDRNGQQVLGRFGFKASMGDLLEQSALALALDIGIGNPVYPDPWGDCTDHQDQCRARPHGNSPAQEGLEASSLLLEALVSFVSNIPPPPTLMKEHAGKAVFKTIGCGRCHHPEFTLNDGRTIAPYTDLLLHDMGDELADPFGEGQASGRDWRTAPLWGLSLNKTSLLHDGRANSVTEAILWHGGEASKSRDMFISLSAPARRALLEFLESL
jgi:CxxC motif-containing protein (DUF1111 family)